MSILDDINKNILKEDELNREYEEWRVEDEWIETSPTTGYFRSVDKPCLYCGKLCYKAGNEACVGFSNLIYPTCHYCKKKGCKCLLKELHREIRYYEG